MTPGAKRAAAYLALAVACAAAIGALGLGLDNRTTVNKIERKVIRIGDPCIDENGKKPGVVPSVGCRKYRRLLDQVCVDDPVFCRRSQRAAIEQTQRQAARRIGRQQANAEVENDGRRTRPHADIDRPGNRRGGRGNDDINSNPPGNSPSQPPGNNQPPNNPGNGNGNGGNNGNGNGGNNNSNNNDVEIDTDPPRIKVDPPPIVTPVGPPIDVPPVCLDLNLLKSGLQC